VPVPQRWFIGVSSGSGADGVEAVLAAVDGVGLELRLLQVQGLHQPFGPELRNLLRHLPGPGPVEVRQVSRLHRLLGETFAAAARMVADHASLSLQQVQCIAVPGHRVWHDTEGRFPSTLGLGMASVVAERTGVSTVSELHGRDVAAGGQGTPLAALPDYLLFRHPQEGRAIVHLGGTARVVFLPPGCRAPEIIGFEAGPCNLLLDALMRQLTGGKEPFDAGGKHAVQGRCIEPLLQAWMSHAFFQRRPPKALPRHLFGAEFTAQAVVQARQREGTLHDLLCTATHFAARCIVHSLRRLLPAGQKVQRVLLAGGGVRNGLLWHLLERQLHGTRVARTEELGVPCELHKALAFALLGALTVDGVPANVPSATGAAGSRLLGCLTPGSPQHWARLLAWMASQTAPVTAEAFE
jgi:anhydro-N-acetylmuramic acid kinase